MMPPDRSGAARAERRASFAAACRTLPLAAIDSVFVGKVVATFAARIILVAVGLITSVVTARALGPEGRGLCAMAAALSALGVQVGNFGLHASNVYSVSRDRSLLPALVGNSLLVSVVAGGLGAVAAWATFAVWPTVAPVRGLLLSLALAGVPFGLASMLLQNLLLGVGDVRAYNATELAAKTAAAGLIVLLVAVTEVSPETVVGAGLATVVASVVWSLRRLARQYARRPRLSLSLFLENLRYGLRAYVAAILAFLVLRIDLVLVRYLLGLEAAGHYSIATAIAELLSLPAVVAGTVLFPHLSALSDAVAKWRAARRVAIAVGLGMSIAIGAAFLLSDAVIRLLYGDAFTPAVPALEALLPGVLFVSINVVFMNYFAALGMPAVTMYGPAAALLVGSVAALLLIPRLGVVGASVGSSLAYGVMLAGSLVYQSTRHSGAWR